MVEYHYILKINDNQNPLGSIIILTTSTTPSCSGNRHRVVRYNDESSFDLDNDFEMNQVSTKTWPYIGPIWATIWAPYEQPLWGQYGFCLSVSYGTHVGNCPHFFPEGTSTVLPVGYPIGGPR